MTTDPIQSSDSAVVAEFTEAALRLGRNAGPALMFDWWYGGKLTLGDLRAVITDVWESAERPALCLGCRDWVDLFRTVGFVADDDSVQPEELIQVYRGSTWGRRRGMSWTVDRDRAEWFAKRYVNVSSSHVGHVFEATVPPEAVLAFVGMSDEGRGEREVVVDPSMLPPLGRSSIVNG